MGRDYRDAVRYCVMHTDNCFLLRLMGLKYHAISYQSENWKIRFVPQTNIMEFLLQMSFEQWYAFYSVCIFVFNLADAF